VLDEIMDDVDRLSRGREVREGNADTDSDPD